MWRDPLDELIEELEHALPPSSVSWQPRGPRLEDLQWAMGLLMYARTDEELAEANRAMEEIHRPGYRSRFPTGRSNW
jgi:hypothetical protein